MAHFCDLFWLTRSALDFWGAEVPGANPASPTKILMRSRIIARNNEENLKAKKISKNIYL